MIRILKQQLTSFLRRKATRLIAGRRRVGVRFEPLEPRDLLATVDLAPIADNTLYEATSSNISNGAGQYFFAGNVGGPAGLRRGILRFDVASALPANAQIDSVTLTLHLSQSVGVAETIALQRVLADWSEGTTDAPAEEDQGAPASLNSVTWRYRSFPNALWPTSGGSYSTQASATQIVDAVGVYQWSSSQLAADVRNWFNNPAQQYGWIVKDADEAPGLASVKRFDTRENPTTAFRPVLTINYSQITNHAPTLVHPIADQFLFPGQPLQLNLPLDTFVDNDPGQSLSLLVTTQDGFALPEWLSFDESTMTFSGTPTVTDLGIYPIAVSAFDTGQPQKSTTANFQLFVLIAATPWQNPTVPADVDHDGFIVPLDALQVINQLNEPSIAAATGLLPALSVSVRPPPFLDVNGDGFVTPLDALVIINYLNSPQGAGEGESPALLGARRDLTSDQGVVAAEIAWHAHRLVEAEGLAAERATRRV